MSAHPVLMTCMDVPAAPADAARRARFRGMVVDHFSDIWRFLRHLGVAAHGIDDAAQDVFLIAWQRLDDIRTGSERPFLFTTAFRTAQSLRRRRSPETADADVDDHLDTSRTPEEQLDDKQACDLAMRLLKGLEEDLRVVFVLYEMEGFSMQQIAELVDVPLGTVASRLRRARDTFQTRFARRMSPRGER